MQAPRSSVPPCEADGDNQEDEKDELPPPIYHTPFQQMHILDPQQSGHHLLMEIPHHAPIAQPLTYYVEEHNSSHRHV